MNPWIVLAELAAVATIFVMLPVGLAVYTHYRRPRLVRCPVGGWDATIQVEAGRAALAAALGGQAMRVTACSSWPRQAWCGQPCRMLPDEAFRPAPARAARAALSA